MNEIYRHSTTNAVTLGVTGASVVKVTFSRNGEEIGTSTVDPAAIPYAATQMSGPLTVKWEYTVSGIPYVIIGDYDIVTPIFNKDEIVAWDSDFSILSDSKVKNLEHMIRKIIEGYCGQQFEIFKGKITITRGVNGVWIPNQKVFSIDNANYTIEDSGHSIINIDTYTSQGYNVKIPIEAEAYTQGVHSHTHSSIQVDGVYGWASIPPAVKTAALYIAESFTCKESLWRERYIKSIRAADWRFDFSEQTFSSTGSIISDQIIDPYRRIGYSAV